MHERSAKLGRNVVFLIAVSATLAGGCSDEDVPRLGDYLQDFELEGPREKGAYVSLGEFNVPVAVKFEETRNGKTKTAWVEVKFRLSAETSPEFESTVRSAAKAARGNLNDVILTAIRVSSLQELTDPRLAALKARMSDAARPILGKATFRQLVLSDLAIEKL